MDTEFRKLIWEINGVTKDELELTEDEILEIHSEDYEITIDGKTTVWGMSIQTWTVDDKYYVDLKLDVRTSFLTNFEISFALGIESEKIDFHKNPEYIQSDVDPEIVYLAQGSQCFLEELALDIDDIFNSGNGYITDGRLTFFCELTFWKKAKLAFKLFFNDDFKDCELQTSDGKIFKAHKAILADQSPVFDGMFKIPNTKEMQTNRVVIEDVNSRTMQQFLRFIYGLEIEKIAEMAFDLFIAADKYLVKQLKKICIKYFTKGLNRENVIQLLTVADKFADTKELHDSCMFFIARKHQSLRKTLQWKTLPESLLRKIETEIPEFKDHPLFNENTL